MTIQDISALDGVWDFSIDQELVGAKLDLRMFGVMKNGALTGFDSLGGSWIVLVTFLEDNELGFLATIELRHANAGVTMPNERGQRVRDKVEYRGTLQVSDQGEALTATGYLELGLRQVTVTARKILGFND